MASDFYIEPVPVEAREQFRLKVIVPLILSWMEQANCCLTIEVPATNVCGFIEVA